MADTLFSWVDSYEAIATALLEYENKQDELCAIVYDVIGERYEAMDPFTFFSMFNGKRRNRDKRIEAVKKITNAFGVETALPTDFEGVPLTNPQKWLYWDGAPHTIEHNWQLFKTAIALADSHDERPRDDFARIFDIVRAQGNIGDATVTMALYWARPHVFLPLDNNTRTYVRERLGLSVPAPISGKTYLSLLDSVRQGTNDDFPTISYSSWAEPADDISTLGDDNVSSTRYWLYAPGEGASMWDEYFENGLMGVGWRALGDLTAYASKAEIRSKLQEIDGSESKYFNAVQITWQFVHDVKPGDVVFAKRGRSEILGRGIVMGDYTYDANAGHYPNLREVRWTHRGSWTIDSNLHIKTLTEVTDYTELISQVSAFFDIDEDAEAVNIDEPAPEYPSYDKEEFLSEVFMSEERYDTLVGVLRTKKNIILQGAPGVGNYVGTAVMLGNGP